MASSTIAHTIQADSFEPQVVRFISGPHYLRFATAVDGNRARHLPRLNTMRSCLALAVSALLALGACSTDGDDGRGLPSTTTTAVVTSQGGAGTITTSPPASTTTSRLSNVPTETVLTAIDDLAERLDVEPREIRLIESEEVVWDDASLGCPDPDVTYATSAESGYRIVLNRGERAFDYHAGADGEPFLCPSGERDGGYDFMPPPGFDT